MRPGGKCGVLWRAVVAWVTLVSGAAAAALEEGFDFAALKKHVEAEHIGSIPALLAALPTSYRESYVVLHGSASAQAATPASPRVLLYGDDARLVLAFNDEKSRGGSTIESLEFDRKKSAFVLRKIDFVDGKARVSDDNPAECRRCHRDDPRPNWESYPTWPGAVGSVSHPHETGKWRNLEPVEEGYWRAFVDAAAKHPRYQYLLGLESKFRFRNKDAPYRYDDDRELHPPTHLSFLFSIWNGQRMARRLRESDGYARYKYALWAALEGCERLEAFVPEKVRKEFTGDLESYRALTKKAFVAGKNPFEYPKDYESPDLRQTSGLRWLLEGRKQVMRDWSMNFRSHRYGFVAPAGSGPLRLRGIAIPLLAADADIAAFDKTTAKKPFAEACELLKEASLGALAVD